MASRLICAVVPDLSRQRTNLQIPNDIPELTGALAWYWNRYPGELSDSYLCRAD